MRAINWHMPLYVFVSLHEKVCLFQINHVAVKDLKELQKMHVPVTEKATQNLLPSAV